MLSLSVRDQNIARSLMEKYGDDYEKMARDIKVNTDQLTSSQLERLITKYKKLLSSYDEPVPTKKEEDDDASLLEYDVCYKKTTYKRFSSTHFSFQKNGEYQSHQRQ